MAVYGVEGLSPQVQRLYDRGYPTDTNLDKPTNSKTFTDVTDTPASKTLIQDNPLISPNKSNDTAYDYDTSGSQYIGPPPTTPRNLQHTSATVATPRKTQHISPHPVTQSTTTQPLQDHSTSTKTASNIPTTQDTQMNTTQNTTQTTSAPPAAPPPPVYETVNVAAPDTTTKSFVKHDIEQINPSRDYISNEALVDTQLGRILSQDNPYIKAARDAADKQMNARGLLNSTMAINASQDAAIKNALPIAQQNAQLFGNADLNRQGLDIAGAQNTQQSAYNWDQANQRYVNDLGKMRYQGSLNASDALFKYNADMGARTYDTASREWLMGKEYGYKSVAEDQTFQHDLEKLDKNYELQGKLAEQKGKIALQIDQAGYQFQTDLEKLKIDSATRLALQDKASLLTRQYLGAYAEIMSDPNISDEIEPTSGLSYRQLALNALYGQYKSNLNSLISMSSGSLDAASNWQFTPDTDFKLDKSSWSIIADDGSTVTGTFALKSDGTGYDINMSDGKSTGLVADTTPMYNKNINGTVYPYVWAMRDSRGSLVGYVARTSAGDNVVLNTEGAQANAGWTQSSTPPPPTMEAPPNTPQSNTRELDNGTWHLTYNDGNTGSGKFIYNKNAGVYNIFDENGNKVPFSLDATPIHDTKVGDTAYSSVWVLRDNNGALVGYMARTYQGDNVWLSPTGKKAQGSWTSGSYQQRPQQTTPKQPTSIGSWYVASPDGTRQGGKFVYKDDGSGFNIVDNNGNDTGLTLSATTTYNTTVGNKSYRYIRTVSDGSGRVVGYLAVDNIGKSIILDANGNPIPGGWNT